MFEILKRKKNSRLARFFFGKNKFERKYWNFKNIPIIVKMKNVWNFEKKKKL
jgi:hypothetical protein